MNESTRVSHYSRQRSGGAETPRQRRRRLHKRNHQERAATLRDVVDPRKVLRPVYPGLVFKPFKIPPGDGRA